MCHFEYVNYLLICNKKLLKYIGGKLENIIIKTETI